MVGKHEPVILILPQQPSCTPPQAGSQNSRNPGSQRTHMFPAVTKPLKLKVTYRTHSPFTDSPPCSF